MRMDTTPLLEKLNLDESGKKVVSRNPAHGASLKLWGWKAFVQTAGWTVWALFLMIALGNDWAYPDGSNPTCADSDNKSTKSNAQFCLLRLSLNTTTQTLMILNGFVLGGFVASSRALWLQKRTAYAALCGATRNLLINLASLVPRENQNEVVRWALLGYELSVLKARTLIDSIEGKTYLEESKLIVGDEWESMVNGDRHTTVWFWIQSRAKQLQDAGKINPYELQTICNAITLSRDRANDLMSGLNRDQPAPYVFVVGTLANIVLVFFSTMKGLNFSVLMHDFGGFRVFGTLGIWVEFIALYLFTMIFSLLYDIAVILYNPFGSRAFDINHDAIGGGIRHLATSLLKGNVVKPSALTTNSDASNV